MAQQNFQQQNRPQQQNKPQQTAPGTPVTQEPDQLTTAEQRRVAAALELTKEQDQATEVTGEPETVEEQFKQLMIKSINSLLTGNNTASLVKQLIRRWFDGLSLEEKNKRLALVESGRYMLHQVEEIVNDLPMLTM